MSPLTGPTPSIPPMIITETNYDGQYFVRRGTHQQPRSDSISISSVRINQSSYQVPIFDENGHKINWLIVHMLRVIMLLIVLPILVVLISFNNRFGNTRIFQFSSMISVIAATGSSINSGYFHQPTLPKDEILNRLSLGIDSWTDISCSGKHSYVDEFMYRKTLTDTCLSSYMGYL